MDIVNVNGHKCYFDEEPHKYYIDDSKVPGPSEIAEELGLSDFSCVRPDILKIAQDFGTGTHLATHYYDKEILDFETLDPNIEPYLKGWQLFREEFNPLFTHIEKSVFSPTYMFGGTFDRLAKIGNKIFLIDIKTCTQISYRTTPLQLGAYDIGIKEHLGIKIDDWLVIQLKKDTYEPYFAEKLLEKYYFGKKEIAKKSFLSCREAYRLKPKRRAT